MKKDKNPYNKNGDFSQRIAHNAYNQGQMSLQGKIDSLFDVLAHGDADHREWLKKAITAHFNGQEMPEYQPSLNEKKIAQLEAEIAKLKNPKN